MTGLREIVERYTALGKWGEAVALGAFGLPAAETERVFSAMDEDYHISRFLLFSSRGGASYLIGGARVTHVRMEAGIQESL